MGFHTILYESIPYGSGYFFNDFLSAGRLSIVPVLVLSRCSLRFCREALLVVAETGVAVEVWPGRRFVALEGEAEGCCPAFVLFVFVWTRGIEGFFIFVGPGIGFEATTAAILAEGHTAGATACATLR